MHHPTVRDTEPTSASTPHSGRQLCLSQWCCAGPEGTIFIQQTPPLTRILAHTKNSSFGTWAHVVTQKASPVVFALFTQTVAFASVTQDDVLKGLSSGNSSLPLLREEHHEQPLSALHDFASKYLPWRASWGASWQP